MGRNLFKAPLGVLREQAEETRIHLRAMQPVRDAFVAAEQDLPGLERALASAIDAGSAASLAMGLAEEAVRREGDVQRELCSGYTRWCRRLRLRLAQAANSGVEARVSAAKKLRSQLGDHPGRRFAGTLDALRRVVPEVTGQASVLRTARWKPDLVRQATALLVAAEAGAVRRDGLEKRVRACGRGTARARARLRRALMEIRDAWNVAIDPVPDVPRRMPLGTLEAYAAKVAASRTRR